jgi:hypothetical protein
MITGAWWAIRNRRRILALAGSALAMVAMSVGFLMFAVGAAIQGSTQQPQPQDAAFAGCISPAGGDPLAGMTPDQQAIAATIVRVARERNLPQRAAVIGLATAYQETKFTNYLTHTDSTTSLGILGQMTVYYGHDVATTPALAIGAFYDRLVKQPAWDTRPLTDVAADVQLPFEPYRGLYAQWETLGSRITAQLWGAVCAPAAQVSSSGRIARDSEQIDCLTNAVLSAVVAAVGPVRVMQGSWSTDVAASGQTHAGAGASDWVPLNGNYDAAVAAARLAGGIAWHRTPAQGFPHHIHMIIPEQGVSPSAQGQVDDFHRGGDGLGGRDYGPTFIPYSGTACAA